MKVIDLLNKIVNGEEVPEKVKFDGYIFEKNLETDYTCFVKSGEFKYLLNEVLLSQLNDEIEIIEEPKKIEKLKINDDNKFGLEINGHFDNDKIELVIAKKLNELIDKVIEMDGE